MNKTAIKNFAAAARIDLFAAVKQKAFEYEITENGKNDPSKSEVNGHVLTENERRQRRQLIDRIDQIGFFNTMEEAAYTWFNRFTALRFMEVNGYLPSKIRVFTDSNNAFKPEILSEAIYLELENTDHDYIMELLESQENEKLYKYLLIAQCNALNRGLPEIFETICGWTELLFPNNMLRNDSVIAHMIRDIPEEDWLDQVQIIGWLYQYYNSEPKDRVFADLKKNIKVLAEDIPAATQLFTPDWIVRYMVENSLGRLWTETHSMPENADWEYYLEEAEQEESVKIALDELRNAHKRLQPEQIKVLDPCMGSGHILVYAFDVLMDIYTSCGWSERDAAESVLKNNLYGLDIDRRAYQLAYFAVMMKARRYSRRILNPDDQPNLANFADVSGVDTSMLTGSVLDFAEQFESADNYGSLMDLDKDLEEGADLELSFGLSSSKLKMMRKIYSILTQKYEVVCTNPPYMGSSSMNEKLSEFVRKKYPDSKSDLFACFIERCMELTKSHGYCSMITQHSFMFLSSFENLRRKLMKRTIVNMAHLGSRAFSEIGGEVVQTAAFVLSGHIPEYRGTYVRLVDSAGENEKRELFLSGQNRFTAKQERFSEIPGQPAAYWVSENFMRVFEKGKLLGTIADSKQGIATADNSRFLREWFEVEINNIRFDAESHEDSAASPQKWYPYNKGGDYRKWYGNNEYVVNWQHDGAELKDFKKSVIRNPDFYFRECFSWSLISASSAAFRYKPPGHIFDVAGMSCFSDDHLMYLLALCNSECAAKVLEVIAPTINYQCGDIANIPVILPDDERTVSEIEDIVRENIEICRKDWDSFEISWDFEQHPLL